MLWGQSYVLPMTWGVGGIWGAPLVDMQPYGCFIGSFGLNAKEPIQSWIVRPSNVWHPASVDSQNMWFLNSNPSELHNNLDLCYIDLMCYPDFISHLFARWAQVLTNLFYFHFKRDHRVYMKISRTLPTSFDWKASATFIMFWGCLQISFAVVKHLNYCNNITRKVNCRYANALDVLFFHRYMELFKSISGFSCR